MKVSPVATAASVVQEAPDSMVQKVRSLKMNTNATPGYVPQAAADGTTVPPVVEAAPSSTTQTTETPQAATEDNQPLSPQLAELARRRRALQVKERELAEKEKAIAASSQERIELAKIKSDPLGVLLNAGVTYDQLTEAVLANQNGYNPEIQALKAEIAALKEGVGKEFSERETRAEQDALRQMGYEAQQIIADGDDFELVREMKQVPTVLKLIEKHYRATGEVLGVRQALGLVETELLKDNLRIANFKKVQSQLTPPQANAPAPQQTQRPGMRTLTNRDTASVPLDRKQRAMMAFAGTLKK